ncbi:hypothetical protein D9758_007302 [Tetrapyrgos nigripes]|uniref:Uncharacterized protein n=1 Tax=Tetrapyrgos nigripes TaxID=182062 RepID=A0A8H5GB42_9AGAR|nr:hypothetical protein D9758_007302 [Tetrapyrgos nigripes]
MHDGRHTVIDLNNKWSTTILKELMEVSGGDAWQKWKRTAQSEEKPVVPGEKNETSSLSNDSGSNVTLLSYAAFRAANPIKPKEKTQAKATENDAAKEPVKPTQKKVKGGKVEAPFVEELKLDPTKTGAAAILP